MLVAVHRSAGASVGIRGGSRRTGFGARLLALLLLAGAASVASGQSGGPAFSFDPDDQAQAAGGLDAINPYNGILSLALPIGPSYPVGPGLSFQIRLYYSSRIWSPGTWVIGPPVQPRMLLDGDPALGLGWRLGFGQIVEGTAAGVPLAYVSPDGSAHRLYNKRIFNTGSPDGFFYSRDGSYLRVKYVSSMAGYQVWTPDGNLVKLGQNVKGYDDVPTGPYQSDFGRGRDGWHTTRIEDAYGDGVDIDYQASGTSGPCGPPTNYCWVPNHITVASVGGNPSTRSLQVRINGTHVGFIDVKTFGNATSTYTLHIATHGFPLTRPYPQPTVNAPQQAYLDSIDLPMSGYTHSFTYFDGGTTTSYANGAMAHQQIPTGATVDYQYRLWSWYHANPLNRPSNCGYPIVQYPTGRPTIRTAPDQSDPFLTDPGTDCAAADRSAGVVKRTLSYTTINGTATATTRYYQYDYGDGEPGSGATTAQSQTVVVSPTDAGNNQHSTTYLFNVSTPLAISGPFVGSLVRTAVYGGDLGQQSSVPSTSQALRVKRLTYGSDAFDTNPVNPSSEAFEANRRLTQDVTIYSGIGPTSPPSGKYHTIVYGFDPNAGQYNDEQHSGTIGGDARETTTTWVPVIDATHWKLDVPQTLHLKPTVNGSDFSRVDNQFDSEGFVTLSTITDSTYGTLAHASPRDATHGNVTSETFSGTGVTGSYARNLGWTAGSLASSQWSSMSWKSVDNVIDGATGLASRSTDPSGVDVQFTYDALGRPVDTTPQSDAATHVTYNSTTQATSITSLSGTEYAKTVVKTDSLGRVLKTQRTMPGGAVAKKLVAYDGQGNKTSESEWIDDGGSDTTPPKTTFSNFDHFGRPKTITKPDGKSTTIDYSDTGTYPNSVWNKVVTIGDVGGNSSATTYLSDAFGNLTSVTEPAPVSASTTYQYNAQDRLTQITQGAQTRNYTYDAFGFLRKEDFPEKKNQVITYAYDPLGNVLTESQPSQPTVTRTYDAAGRLRTVKDGSTSYQENCYDGNGTCGDANNLGGTYPKGKLTHRAGFNPGTATAGKVMEDFDYSDPSGRLSHRTTTNNVSGGLGPLSESWIYGPSGDLVKYTHPRASGLFSVESAYDHHFPMEVRADGLRIATATYQRSGMLASYTTGTGMGFDVTTTIAEDTTTHMARPARISTTGAAPTFDTGSYTYDGAGNVRSMGTDAFGYDRLSRLTCVGFAGAACAAGSSGQAYSYDRWGNLTGVTGANPRSYSVDTAYNRLNANGATYDGRGNLLTIGSPVETYTWDALDRMTTYKAPGASTAWQYLYSGAGERLIKVPPSGGASNFIWTFRDEANRIATEFVGPNVSRDDVYLGNLLVGSYASCGTNGPPGWTFYSSDHLGSPRLITDINAAVVDARKYWPYGEEAAGQTLSSQRVRFASMERDSDETSPATNRYYDHARSYDFFNVGRFLGVDKLPGHGNSPGTLNRYSYTRGNPIRFLDPEGLDVGDIGATIGGFVPGKDEPIELHFEVKAFHDFNEGLSRVMSGFFVDGYLFFDPQYAVLTEETCYCQTNINYQGLAAVIDAAKRVGPTADLLGAGLLAWTSALGGEAFLGSYESVGAGLSGLNRPMVGDQVFRLFDRGRAGPFGKYWSTMNPTASGYRSSVSLGAWNAGEFQAEGELIDTTGVVMRRASPAGGGAGGGIEYIVPDPLRQIRFTRVRILP